MKNFFQRVNGYVKESYSELAHKVSWPTQQELASSTVVVMIASLIMACVISVIDLSFETIVKIFYSKIF
jgi:preprotein translocase subunit SecE